MKSFCNFQIQKHFLPKHFFFIFRPSNLINVFIHIRLSNFFLTYTCIVHYGNIFHEMINIVCASLSHTSYVFHFATLSNTCQNSTIYTCSILQLFPPISMEFDQNLFPQPKHSTITHALSFSLCSEIQIHNYYFFPSHHYLTLTENPL